MAIASVASLAYCLWNEVLLKASIMIDKLAHGTSGPSASSGTQQAAAQLDLLLVLYTGIRLAQAGSASLSSGAVLPEGFEQSLWFGVARLSQGLLPCLMLMHVMVADAVAEALASIRSGRTVSDSRAGSLRASIEMSASENAKVRSEGMRACTCWQWCICLTVLCLKV